VWRPDSVSGNSEWQQRVAAASGNNKPIAGPVFQTEAVHSMWRRMPLASMVAFCWLASIGALGLGRAGA
jgi:hypothetical protein